MERLHTWGPGPNSSLQRLYRCAAKTSCSSWISAVRSRRPAAADRNGNAASGRLPGRLGLFTTCQLIGSCRGVARRRRDASRSGIRHARHGHFVRARKRWLMAAVMIGVDPHKSSHRGGDRACRGASGRVAGRCVARLVGGSQAGIERVHVSHRSSPFPIWRKVLRLKSWRRSGWAASAPGTTWAWSSCPGSGAYALPGLCILKCATPTCRLGWVGDRGVTRLGRHDVHTRSGQTGAAGPQEAASCG